MTLPELLDACSDAQSPQHRKGWLLFMDQFQPYIERKVIHYCTKWNVPRLGFQFNECANDIQAQVFEILCQKDFRALRNFKERDNEYRFMSYLSVICHNATAHYMKKYLKHLADVETDDLRQLSTEMADDTRGQLFEYVVHQLRSAKKKLPKNFERDLNLYLLYVWGDFSKEMIVEMPAFRGQITPKMVDLAVYRLRGLLRELESE